MAAKHITITILCNSPCLPKCDKNLCTRTLFAGILSCANFVSVCANYRRASSPKNLRSYCCRGSSMARNLLDLLSPGPVYYWRRGGGDPVQFCPAHNLSNTGTCHTKRRYAHGDMFGITVFSPGFFDRMWGHPYCKLPMQRAHHPHTSIHGKSVPHLGQCLSFFAWMQQDA